jgi:hypothetical protein
MAAEKALAELVAKALLILPATLSKGLTIPATVITVLSTVLGVTLPSGFKVNPPIPVLTAPVSVAVIEPP